MELDKNCIEIELIISWVDYFEEIETTLMGSDFLSLFFELFADLMKVIRIIC